MVIFLSVVAFILGAIIGSFLNVVIYRLHTGKSLSGRSHCLSCGAGLQWHELVPVVSYIVLLGRCRHCGARIPVRYAAVELTTALTFLGLFTLYSAALWLFAFYAVFFSILIVIAAYDLRHTIIPDELTATLFGLAVVFVSVSAYAAQDIFVVLWSLAGASLASLFFGALWYVSGGRWMGFGDAKLAFPFGLIVGFPEAYSMIVLSFVIGAAVSIVLLLLQRFVRSGTTPLRYGGVPLTIKSEVPFAPFLIAGFVLTGIFHADVFDITFALLTFF